MKTTPKTKPVGRRIDPSKDLLSEWKKSSAFTAQWSSFLASNLGKMFMDVMHQKIPQGFPTRQQPIASEQACVELGRIEGYRDALRIIESLANETIVKQSLKATYQPPQ